MSPAVLDSSAASYALDPAMPVLLRPDGAVQVGWDPRRAVLVRPPGGLAAADLAALLRSMSSPTPLSDLQRRARDRGLRDSDGLTTLVTQLVGAGVATESAPTRGRAASVRIHGRGPISELLVEALRCSGARIAHSSQPHAGVSATDTDLVVLADYLVADPRLVRDLHSQGVAHMPVRVRDGTGLVGPLVIPGVTSCLVGPKGGSLAQSRCVGCLKEAFARLPLLQRRCCHEHRKGGLGALRRTGVQERIDRRRAAGQRQHRAHGGADARLAVQQPERRRLPRPPATGRVTAMPKRRMTEQQTPVSAATALDATTEWPVETELVGAVTQPASGFAWSAEEGYGETQDWPEADEDEPLHPWLDALGATAPVLFVLAVAAFVLTVGGFIWIDHSNGQVDSAPPAVSVAAPNGALTPSSVTAPPLRPDPILTGTYELAFDSSKETYRGNAVPPHHTGIKTRWWAFRSQCSSSECTASGVKLDDNAHTAPHPMNLSDSWTYDNGQWVETPVSLSISDVPGCSTATTHWELRPQPDGTLAGTETATVEGGCQSSGNTTVTPFTATRIGPVPPGLWL